MQDRPRHNLFLILLMLAIGAVAFGKNSFAANVEVQTPVNAQPMDELTSYFAKKQLVTDNRLYTYYLYAPPKPWPEGVKFPVVLVMHGTPGFSYAAKYLISGDIATKYPAFVVVPVLKAQTHWAIAPARPKAKILPPMFGLTGAVNIIRSIAKDNPIDPARIYAVGCSLGGSGALGASRFYPEIFAGAVAISSGWDPADGINMTHTPLWIVHGRHDGIAPAENAAALASIIESRGGPVRYTEISDMGHECPAARLYAEPLWKWLFSQRKSP